MGLAVAAVWTKGAAVLLHTGTPGMKRACFPCGPVASCFRNAGQSAVLG